MYDTTSGNGVLTLTPPASIAGAAMPGNTTALTWSPDGKRLAYLDSDLAALIVWEPETLAALAAPAH